jgi:transposase
MERDEIRALMARDPESIVTLIVHLEETIALLEARIAELEHQLHQNSTNSSRPPSSDGFKRPTKRRKPGKNPPGGKKGHKGHTLEFIDNPDVVETHRASVCEGCGASLAGVPPTTVERRQVSDIPPPRIYVTEHRGEAVICPRCGQKHAAPFPDDVSSPLQYGPYIRSLMVYLCIYQLVPYDRACEFFGDVYGREPSKGTLIAAAADCSNNLVEVEAGIKELLLNEPALNVDETGMRVNGKRKWLHSASTAHLTFYAHHDNRGTKAMDEIGIIPQYGGVLIHDCWRSYFRYTCSHALCNAHLLRELEGISENYGQKWSDALKDLLIEILNAVRAAPDAATSLDPFQIEEYSRRYVAILESGREENPISLNPEQKGKRGRVKKTRAQNLIARCGDHKEDFLRFMTDFRVPFTNNQAERDVRMVKVQQKISGTFRSTEGPSNFCRIRGYISTVKKNRRPVLEAIRGAFEENPFTPDAVYWST